MNRTYIRTLLSLALLFGALQLPTLAIAQAFDVNAALRAVNKASAEDRKINADRERTFKSKLGSRQSALKNMTNERVKQERLSASLEKQFNVNEVKIVDLQEELKKELGDLKELFGVIQQTASEAQEEYKTSIISAQYPERVDTLQNMVAKMASLSELVSIDEIEELWFHLQNEMTEQGKIVSFDMPVKRKASESEVEESGLAYTTENRTVTRIGVFGAMSGEDLLRYEHNNGYVMLDRRMDSAYTNAAVALQSSTNGVTTYALDPTKGALLQALVKKPSMVEKVQEGKIIGFVILGLGAIAVLIAALRIFLLSIVAAKVKRQTASNSIDTANPLGRLLAVFDENQKLPGESMELIAMEAIQKESPSLNRGITIIKVIAVVAPLLGLLGTVTGMIQTFQAITLFGAGDPQMMAGGISQALVTTVLGLVVAIPAVFLHSLASGKAQSVEDTLEEQAARLLSARES